MRNGKSCRPRILSTELNHSNMAPSRYGQQPMNPSYSHYQQNPLQQHHTSQQNALQPPPNLGTSAFNSGNPASSTGFATAGLVNNGYDRNIHDGGVLSGQAGQMGYPRGGPVQAQQTYENVPNTRAAKEDERIRNVWASNLKREMATLRDLVDEFPYIAMVC